MLRLIPRCPEYVSGYRDYCREMYDCGVVYFRPTPPRFIDEGWFERTRPVYDQKEQGQIEGQGSRAQRLHIDGDIVAQAHDGALAVVFFNFRNRGLQRLFPVAIGGRHDGGDFLLVCHWSTPFPGLLPLFL